MKTLFQQEKTDINPENTKVYVEFIMDGAGAKPGEDKTFALKVVVDPVIKDDKADTQLYVNHPPCTGGVINIKVLLCSEFNFFFFKVLLSDQCSMIMFYYQIYILLRVRTSWVG